MRGCRRQGRLPFGISGCSATAKRRRTPRGAGVTGSVPSTARGRRDATALGARLADTQPMPGLKGIPPIELIICSAAVRTRQTADLIVKELGGHIPIDPYHSLYQADAEDMAPVCAGNRRWGDQCADGWPQPSVYQLAWELVAGHDGRAQRPAIAPPSRPTDFRRVPLAVLTLEVPGMGEVAAECGRLSGLFKPPY